MSLRYKVAVVGASETTQIGVIPDMTYQQLAVDAALNAIEDCGIDKNQIDGIASNVSPAELAQYLGIVPSWVNNTLVGGTSFLIQVRHAAAAIAER
ncbi:MAG: thiolase, partial [Chloroflexi bacterium]|nr:thiolase [Chloroflexota bacterium]